MNAPFFHLRWREVVHHTAIVIVPGHTHKVAVFWASDVLENRMCNMIDGPCFAGGVRRNTNAR